VAGAHGLRRLLVAGVFGVAVALVTASSIAAGQALQATIWGVSAALVTAVLPELLRWAGGRGRHDRSLDAKAAWLANQVRRRVQDSPVRVRLNRPMPLRVWYHSVDKGHGLDQLASAATSPGHGLGQQSIHDHVGRVAERLRELPWRQLVVLGPPGSGKSVLAVTLVHQLLADPGFRVQADPVPVLIAASSWNPAAEPITAFITRRLREDFGLGAQDARDLVESTPAGKPHAGAFIMPVLDGLDEVAGGWHAAALQAVEEFTRRDRPIAVTCRAREFAAAIVQSGELTRATVVQLEPLGVDDVAEFLEGAQPYRWHEVSGVLRAGPDSVLARVLSTPLMAGLAKDTFDRRDPAELLGADSEGEILRLLMDGYVAAVYETAGRIRIGRLQSLHPQPRAAAKWLSNLAYLAECDGTRDLRWWRLPWNKLWKRPILARRTQLVGIAAAVASVVFAVMRIRGGVGSALSAAAMAGVLVLAAVSGVFDSIFRNQFQPGVGAVVRPLRWLAWRTQSDHVMSAAYGSLFGALSGGLFGLFVHRMSVGVVVGIAVTWLALPVRVDGHLARTCSHPSQTLHLVRSFAMRSAVPFAAVGFVVCWLAAYAVGDPPLRWATVGCLLFASAAALAGGVGLWLRFRIAHLALALYRSRQGINPLPLRLIAFLRHGADPVVSTLRNSGAVWQFRHAIIQDHLIKPVHLERTYVQTDEEDRVVARALAASLRQRGDVDDAIAVLRRASEAGDREATRQLIKTLRELGDIDGAAAVLRRIADTGEKTAVHELAGLLRDHGDLDGAIAALRPVAEAGDQRAMEEWTKLLRTRGDARHLRRLAEAGNHFAMAQLVALLRERDDTDELLSALRLGAVMGNRQATRELIVLLCRRGDVDGALAVLRTSQALADRIATIDLVDLLRERGDSSILRELADAGSGYAGITLARLLRHQGDMDGAIAMLQQSINLGEGITAVPELAELLYHRGDLEAAMALLDQPAATGSWAAAEMFAGVVLDSGDVDGAIAVLRRLADAGDIHASTRLVELLHQRGDVDELWIRADARDWAAAEHLAKLLRERRDTHALTMRANAGDAYALGELVQLMRECGDLEGAYAVQQHYREARSRPFAKAMAESTPRPISRRDMLRRQSQAGNVTAARQLAADLRQNAGLEGAITALRELADDGYTAVAMELVTLLREAGDVDEATALLEEMSETSPAAARELAALLALKGETKEAIQRLQRLVDAGDPAAASQLAELLRGRGDARALRRQVDAGNRYAVEPLAALLREQGDVAGAIAVLRKRADARDGLAAQSLARLLREAGDTNALRRRADAGDGYASRELAGLLRERGDIDALRQRADANDGEAAAQLASLLRERGDIDAAIAILRQRTNAGSGAAAKALEETLRERDDRRTSPR